MCIFNHLSFENFSPQFPVSQKYSIMCLTSFSPEYKGHLPLSVFCLTPLSCYTPASNHTIPFLSFLQHQSMYSFLLQETFISLYSVNELFSENFAKIFYLSVSLHLSLTVFISVKLQSCCFLHMNASSILYSSSFISIIKLPTLIFVFCHS